MMRITKAGLLATAGFLILFSAGIIEAALDGLDALPAVGLLVYVAVIAVGIALLCWALSVKARTEAAEDAAQSGYTRTRWSGAVPEPCQLCYMQPARVRCREHKLDICIGCCARHDNGFRCTLYLTENGNFVMKARA